MTPTQSIIKFNQDRNLTVFDGLNEVDMLEQELQELRSALDNNDSHEIIDALNDLRVIAEGALWKYGQDPTLSIKQTCKEILSREGAVSESGKWEKDRDQDPSTLYTADYTLSKRQPQ